MVIGKCNQNSSNNKICISNKTATDLSPSNRAITQQEAKYILKRQKYVLFFSVN